MYAGSPSKHRLHPTLVMPPRPLNNIVDHLVKAVGVFHYGNEPSPARQASYGSPSSPSKSRAETQALATPILWDTHEPPKTDSSIQLQYKPVVALSPDEASSLSPERGREDTFYSLSADFVTERSPSLPAQGQEISHKTPLQTFEGKSGQTLYCNKRMCSRTRAHKRAIAE